jgi:hypothetical protein
MLWQGATSLFEGVGIEGQTMEVRYDDLFIEARQTILSCEVNLWRASGRLRRVKGCTPPTGSCVRIG